ncbi:MAG: M48 family metalloprotease [Granulosicoccaceae bacterium]
MSQNNTKSTPRNRPQQRRRRRCVAVFCGLLLSAAAAVTLAQQNLPNMGEPADSTLSPLQEQAMGAGFMRQIRASVPLIRDVQLQEYIKNLGNRLALASGKTANTQFTFFIVEDKAINAFAIPGGYVGVNVGLIDAMELEGQLAAVMAHEVAHVTQRHHARSFALGTRNNMSAAAAILAAIVIGQASPQAGQAALAAGLAATQQSAVNFTRANEVEADRIGIEILANAQYSASSMAESFSILRRKNRLNTSAGALEYLRTHPLDNNRIAEARDRASTQTAYDSSQQTDYQLFKARLAVLTEKNSGQLLQRFKASFNKRPDIANTYGLSLLMLRENRLDQAKRYTEELKKLTGHHFITQLLEADLLLAQNKHLQASSKLQTLIELNPDRYSAVEKQIALLVRERKLSDAKNLAKQYLRSAEQAKPRAWRELASIQQQLGDQAASHESLAQYFIGMNELLKAQSQLKLALRHVETASQDELRLQASLKNLLSRPY